MSIVTSDAGQGDEAKSLGNNKSVVTWEHEDLAQVKVKVFRGHSDGVNSCQFFKENTRVSSASSDGSAIVWNFDTGKILSTFRSVEQMPLSQAHTNDDGTRLAASSWDKNVYLWDTETESLLWSSRHDAIVTCCRISFDGKKLMTGTDYDNSLHIFDVSSGELIHKIPEMHDNTVTSCLFAPRDDKVITTSMDKSTKFLDLRTYNVTIKLGGHINVISSASISNDERKFATASWDKTVKMWDIATGGYRSQGPICLEEGHDGCVSSCFFSEDGSMLASGSYDNTAIVWDTENSMQKLKLQGHTDFVEDVAFSTDKKWIISCSKDKTLRCWNIEDTDNIPVVLEKKKSIGVKMITCTACGKPFSMAQMESFRDVTLCVFCRLQTHTKSNVSLPEAES